MQTVTDPKNTRTKYIEFVTSLRFTQTTDLKKLISDIFFGRVKIRQFMSILFRFGDNVCLTWKYPWRFGKGENTKKGKDVRQKPSHKNSPPR